MGDTLHSKGSTSQRGGWSPCRRFPGSIAGSCTGRRLFAKLVDHAKQRANRDQREHHRALVSIRYVRHWCADNSREVNHFPAPLGETLTPEQESVMRFQSETDELSPLGAAWNGKYEAVGGRVRSCGNAGDVDPSPDETDDRLPGRHSSFRTWQAVVRSGSACGPENIVRNKKTTSGDDAASSRQLLKFSNFSKNLLTET